MLAPLVDEARAVAGVRRDEAAHPVDARVGVGGRPRVAGHDAGVAQPLQQVEGGLPPDHAHVVGVEEHLALHHPADQVLPEVGQPAVVAVRRRAVERERDRRPHAVLVLDGAEEAVPLVERAGVGGRELLAVLHLRGVRRGAPSHVPEGAGLQEVGGVHRDPGLAGVTGHARQRVVELVDQLHLRDAERADLVELPVDGRPGARGVGHVGLLGAAEQHATSRCP